MKRAVRAFGDTRFAIGLQGNEYEYLEVLCHGRQWILTFQTAVLEVGLLTRFSVLLVSRLLSAVAIGRRRQPPCDLNSGVRIELLSS